jgi:hypothetical protein
MYDQFLEQLLVVTKNRRAGRVSAVHEDVQLRRKSSRQRGLEIGLRSRVVRHAPPSFPIKANEARGDQGCSLHYRAGHRNCEHRTVRARPAPFLGACYGPSSGIWKLTPACIAPGNYANSSNDPVALAER